MLRLLLGILLMGASFVLLFMFIADPSENSLAQQVQTALHCQPGETFVQELGRYIDNFGTSSDGRELTYYCEDAEGERRDVTGEGVITIMAGFAVPFVLGLLFLLWGIFAIFWKVMRKLSENVVGTMGGGVMPSNQPQMFYTDVSGQPRTTSTSVYTVNGQPMNAADIPPEKMEQIQNVLKTFGMNVPQSGVMSTMNPNADAGANLVAQLKQLEDARNQNLITQEEYDRLRKEILDKMA